MELRTKEVRFDLYCKKCKHWDCPEGEDPCDLCLEEFSNEYSHKPLYFEEDLNAGNRKEGGIKSKKSNLSYLIGSVFRDW